MSLMNILLDVSVSHLGGAIGAGLAAIGPVSVSDRSVRVQLNQLHVNPKLPTTFVRT